MGQFGLSLHCCNTPMIFTPLFFSSRWAVVQGMGIIMHDRSRAACGNLQRYEVLWYYSCWSSQLCYCQSLCIKTCCVQTERSFPLVFPCTEMSTIVRNELLHIFSCMSLCLSMQTVKISNRASNLG